MIFLLHYVEVFLKDAGEFFPIGAIMDMDRNMSSLAGFDGREQPPSEDIMTIIREGFSERVVKHSICASGLAYDVLVTDANGAKEDAICIELDHIDDYSIIVYFPYLIENGVPILQQRNISEGLRRIFV